MVLWGMLYPTCNKYNGDFIIVVTTKKMKMQTTGRDYLPPTDGFSEFFHLGLFSYKINNELYIHKFLYGKNFDFFS